ncbi:MAG: HD domain-containing protein [Oscillospiraceae bacterium]|nr:HD domain-containing protein [Oscillospiraceae bacterium]
MRQLNPPASVLFVLQTLNDAGFEAWAVGGCVRDSLLGHTPHDWDITTSALPQQTMSVFKGHRLLQTGLHHGTVTLLLDHQPIEITTYRVDGTYSDGRRPDSVSFTTNLTQDLARRDFTVNAMAWNPHGGLQDPFGGQTDLQAHLIRCVGDPVLRFDEDALRVVRAIRFSSQLDFSIHPQTAAAVHACAHNLALVASERIFPELLGICCGSNALSVLLEYGDVIGAMLPELAPMLGHKQHNIHHIHDVWQHCVHALSLVEPLPHLRLAALLHDCGKPAVFTRDEEGVGHFYGHGEVSHTIAQNLLKKLACPADLRYKVCDLVKYHDALIPLERPKVRRWFGRLGPRGMLDLLALKRADNGAQNPIYNYTEYYDDLEALIGSIIDDGDCCCLSQLAVNGSDLMALGLKGSAIGEMLQRLLCDVMDGRLPNQRERLLRSVERRLEKQSP